MVCSTPRAIRTLLNFGATPMLDIVGEGPKPPASAEDEDAETVDSSQSRY